MQEQAAEYLVQGQYSKAISLYEQSIEANPTLMSNYWYLGLAQLLAGEASEAQAVWLCAITQGTPEEIEQWLEELITVLTTTAIRLLQKRNLPVATEVYWQILELDASQYKAHYNLGQAIAQQGNFDEAITCWQRAIELKPDFWQAYQHQGQVHQKLANFPAAITCYAQALEIQPDLVETYYNLGLCFKQQGSWDKAITCFQRGIQIQPDFAAAYSDWGDILRQQGKLDEAIVLWQQAIQLQPSFAQAYCDLVDNQVVFQETRQKAEGRGQKGRRFDLFLTFVADGHRRQWGCSSERKANASLLKSLQSSSVSWETFFYLGQVLAKPRNLKVAQGQGAIAAYQQAIQLQPESPLVYLELGKVLVQTGDIEGAIAVYQQAISYPEALQSESLVELRKLLANQGNIEAAVDISQETLELSIDTPQSFYERTQDWVSHQGLVDSNYFPIYPQSIIPLIPPKTPEDTIHFSFRFGSQIELPAPFVAVIPEGHFWLHQDQSTSAVITADNQLLGDLSPEFPILSPGHPEQHPSKHSIFSLGKLPPIQRIEGTVAILAGLLNDLYFHWMLDILPRIELLRQSGIKLAEIDYFLVSSHLPFQKETLKALGIPPTKILETADYPHLQAKKLIVPSFPGTVAWMPQWAINFLKNTFVDRKIDRETGRQGDGSRLKEKNFFIGTALEKIERLYISRQSANNRLVINEQEVISFLNQFGFTSVSLEVMTVRQQAALLAQAKVVISPHGSGLTNIVFCSPGTKVIEIFSPNYVYHCYWLLSNLVGVEYYYLLGETLPGCALHQLIYPNSRIEDIFVNLDELFKIMTFANI
ncbi:MAG: tetratricopeptide repeat protein [Symploca sp. SIO1C2]|nr:tetratricopeptide repeat protein [Symploca sp. SIO1C2]